MDSIAGKNLALRIEHIPYDCSFKFYLDMQPFVDDIICDRKILLIKQIIFKLKIHYFIGGDTETRL